MRHTGLDLSLTATGIAHIETSTNPTTHTITSAGRKTDTLPMRTDRLRRLRNTIVDHCLHSDLVAIEAPAYSSNVGSVWDRAGLWWSIITALDALTIPYVAIPPTTVKKFATDKGNADKTAVAAHMTRLWKDLANPTDNNQFDALALATMAAVHTDFRALPVTVLERHKLSVSGISWPALNPNRSI
ncbi:crossover junction endodeoxyribonuclease RuvC [Gordonia sp. HY285]|uniref:crossover junction endodeoxyribonuclease RuvC n=1 Tax=Gordonia liuliyuniae TaxID=2911517 RepID=UPI001F014187|nr:crossover junction endodeoxyribonuclease RuvC [Gordonia liuliyuniae]MCF8610013.1 crossover junction endodeoxyribonuclease RuvC [Gordonia liuliyuniae]